MGMFEQELLSRFVCLFVFSSIFVATVVEEGKKQRHTVGDGVGSLIRDHSLS